LVPVTGPHLLPAAVVVVVVRPIPLYGKGRADKEEVVAKETVPEAIVKEEAVPEEGGVVEPVEREPPAGEGRASKGSCSWDEHAPAREHAPAEPTKSPTPEPTKSPTVEATATEAAMECRG
jgi:hypothetical protein